jgi:O-antigen/teichoic acid export membrane protein
MALPDDGRARRLRTFAGGAVSLLKRNVIANFAGRISGVLVSLLFVPVYLHFLGAEGYALIGFSLVLFATLQTLDLGLSAAFSRELARRMVADPEQASVRDLARTLETVYWAIGLAIALLLALCAPLIAQHWLKPGALADQAVLDSLRLMAVALALQWPLALYNGGLVGLERQVAMNLLTAGFAVLRGAGAALVLWQVAATPQTYFAWVAGCHALQTAVTALLLWRVLPLQRARPRFRLALLGEVWRFAAGVTVIGLLGAIASQIDKILLSGLLSLESFGYYMLAWTIASALAYLSSPLAIAVAPRFAALFARRDSAALADLYLRACELAAVAVLPVAAVLALFAGPALAAWTGNATTAAATAPLLAILLLGSAVNSLLLVPYQLQLACGEVRLGVWTNVTVVCLYGPLLALVTLQFGALGAACAWLALNTAYVLVVTGLMHRWILPGLGGGWVTRAVLVPAVVALGTAAALRLLTGTSASRWVTIATLAAAWLLVALATAASTVRARATLLAAARNRGGL